MYRQSLYQPNFYHQDLYDRVKKRKRINLQSHAISTDVLERNLDVVEVHSQSVCHSQSVENFSGIWITDLDHSMKKSKNAKTSNILDKVLYESDDEIAYLTDYESDYELDNDKDLIYRS